MGVYACLYVFDDKILHEEIKPLLQSPEYKTVLDNYLYTYFSNKNIQNEVVQQSSLLLDDEFKNLEPNRKLPKNMDYELYCSIFQNLIISKCLLQEPTLRIGKSSLKNRFINKFRQSEWQPPSFAFEMLKKLDGPIFWTHNSGGYHEGIRGWIDATETALLLEDLDNLDFNREHQSYYDNEMLALRIFLEYAVNLNKGILNGGDLYLG